MEFCHELIAVFTRIQDPEKMEIFLREIFTPKELKDLALRWQLLKELHDGLPQRAIAQKHRISLCKITRGSKILKKENSVTKAILEGTLPPF
jgi:TrpR family trp operon transcriptional repressor